MTTKTTTLPPQTFDSADTALVYRFFADFRELLASDDAAKSIAEYRSILANDASDASAAFGRIMDTITARQN